MQVKVGCSCVIAVLVASTGGCDPRVSVGDLGGSGGKAGDAPMQLAVTGGDGNGEGGATGSQGPAAPQGGDGSAGSAEIVIVPDCAPGAVVCLGNQVGTCADDGESLEQVSSDCRGAGQVCNAQGTCVASVTDEIGLGIGLERTDYGKSDLTLVEVLDVEMPRVVTEIEAHLVMEQASELGWLIYELDGSRFRLRAETWTQPEAAGDAYYASGPMSYELEAGKRYALGVSITSRDVEVFVNGAATPTTRVLSFGDVVGGSGFGGGDYSEPGDIHPYSYYPQLRISTELP